MPQATAENLIGIDFEKGTRTVRPLPPPGNPLDGRDYEDLSALYEETEQVTTFTLGGSTSTSDVTTLEIAPTLTASGSAWGDALGNVSVSFTTAGTQTIAAVTAGVEAAASAAQTITTLSDVANFQRVHDIAIVDSTSTTVVVTGRDAGARFTASMTSVDSNGAANSVTISSATTGGSDDDLRVGIVGVSDGLDDEYNQKITYPASGSAAADILGVIMDSAKAKAAEAGDAFKVYKRGSDVVYRKYGGVTVYGEAACTAGSNVYVRKTASATEIAGAVNDSATTDTVNVWTMTPTAANSTEYQLLVKVYNFFTGALVSEGLLQATSDSDGTAAEIVTALKTSLADYNDDLDDYVAGTGTGTLILTATAGYYLVCRSVGTGDLAEVETTAAASDHLLWSGAKFTQTTTAAGVQAIYIPHP